MTPVLFFAWLRFLPVKADPRLKHGPPTEDGSFWGMVYKHGPPTEVEVRPTTAPNASVTLSLSNWPNSTHRLPRVG